MKRSENEQTKLDRPLEAEGDDAIIGSALRWSSAFILLIVATVAVAAFVLNRGEPPPQADEAVFVAPQTRERAQRDPPAVHFSDITSESGIHFRHENGAYGEKLLPETMGGGCAFFDFDSDGDQDLLLVNSKRWSWDPRGLTDPATLALYENDGRGRFEDVSQAAGLSVSLYGMGAAVGDYDNDGDPDLFISAVGSNRLFQNDQGRFTDVTAAAGVAGKEEDWGTSCCWFDYNNDGRLDLFVCNYIRWSRDIDIAKDFQLLGLGRAYGPPTEFAGTHSSLYRNDGKGEFTDVSAEAGIQVTNPATGVPMAKSLGVSPIDLDRDGWMDLIVANDTVQNFLFHNQGDGTFEEIGALAGIAFDSAGDARGAMGTDVSFPHNNETLAIAIGNFATEMTAFYCADEDPLQFVDTAIANGLGPATRLELTFGLFFFDYDLDSRLDLLCANGHLEEEINKVQVSQQYEQPPQLFWNCGPESRTEYVQVDTALVGQDFHRRMVGRGAAFADIDGDGDLDVLLMGVGSAPRLLRNDQELDHHWLRFQLTGTQSNRDAIGAWVELVVGEQTLRRQVMPTRSYLSQSELPVTIGIGKATSIDRARVIWPGGNVETLELSELDRVVEVVQSDESS